MKRNSFSIMSIMTVLLCSAFVIPTKAEPLAGEIMFSYDHQQGRILNWGTLKIENYDVAIHLEGSKFAGQTLKSLMLPFTSTEHLSGLKVWLTKELALNSSKENMPDICTQDAEFEVNSDGYIVVELDKPYTITTDGVFAGYSFVVDNADTDEGKKPLVVTSEPSDEGMYIHTTRQYRKWMNKTDFCTSAMAVVLDGAEAEANSVELTEIKQINAEAGKPVTCKLAITNKGLNGVKDFDLEYTIDGTTLTKHVDLGEQSIRPQFDITRQLKLELDPIAAKGSFPTTMTITRVNGAENAGVSETGTTVNVYSILPKHRSVVEEYTGLWCGWCPRGFVGLELMNKKYGDEFIGISYHNGDIMTITEDYPCGKTGFPSAWIDRVEKTDAYGGAKDPTGTSGFGLDEVWESHNDIFAPADIEASASLDDKQETVTMNAEITFALDISDADYDVECVLLADDLHGEGTEWMQKNYFSGSSGYYFSEGLIDFAMADKIVSGLHFNDIIIASSRLKGNNPSLPSEVGENSTYKVDYSFTLADIIDIKYQKPIVQDVNKLRVVALLIDKTTGAIANACQAKVITDPMGISRPTAEAQGADTYYDLSGRRLQTPQKGVNILRKADGTAVKILVK